MAAELYFTGKPCIRGHVAQRFKSTGNCVECNRIRSRRLSKEPKARERTRRWHLANKEAVVTIWKDYAERNPKRVLANTRTQQAARLKRVPVWCERKEIATFYENCPAGYEVDHIYALQSKTVSGLHVLANLQYLPMIENRKKGNR